MSFWLPDVRYGTRGDGPTCEGSAVFPTACTSLVTTSGSVIINRHHVKAWAHISPVHIVFVWDQDKWRNMTVANALLPPGASGDFLLVDAGGEATESDTDSAGVGARRQAQ